MIRLTLAPVGAPPIEVEWPAVPRMHDAVRIAGRVWVVQSVTWDASEPHLGAVAVRVVLTPAWEPAPVVEKVSES